MAVRFKCSVLISLMFLTAVMYPQQESIVSINGTVTDKTTGEPLAGASVYFGSTTIGTAAQSNGKYLLVAKKTGNYELTVSMVGYKTQKNSIYIRNGNQYTFNFKLEPKAVNVNAVEVEGEDQSEWNRNLDIFRRKFLGSLEASYGCVIENKEILNFKWMSDTLTAFSAKPLIIINNYLGYKIVFELKKFLYSTHSTDRELLYHSFFTELTPSGQDQMEKWQKNREDMYYGSPVHFLWALKNNRLHNERFRVNYASDPSLGKNEVFKEVTNSDDFLYKEQFMEEPLYSFGGCLKISYKENQVSYVKLRFPFFTIDSNGIADNHLPFLCMGYWANLGAADLLPQDYLPESLRK